MNKWTKKSLELTKNSDYLDNLTDIYPFKTADERQRALPKEEWAKNRKGFRRQK